MKDGLWHKCFVIFPRRTVNGGWTGIDMGQTWRRWRDGRWEYRQEEETEREFLERTL